MIKSMTGYGRAEKSINGNKLTIEIRTVNHRYNETMFKMPKDLLIIEDQMKKVVQKYIKRGRVDVFLTNEADGGPLQQLQVDWKKVEEYLAVSAQLKERYNLAGELKVTDILQLPDLIHIGQELIDSETINEEIIAILEEACENLSIMRLNEGKSLYNDLISKISNLEKLLDLMRSRAPYVINEYREKVKTRVAEFLGDSLEIDEERLLNEVAFFTDKANIDEELTRLKSHFEQFLTIIDQTEPIGRKLDFLIQEMNREVNTIGSKANDIQLSRLVVEMKSELEKMREQVQNVE